MSDIEYKIPSNSKEFQEYDLFRWKILRKPIGKSIESLKDEFEDLAFHLIGVKNNRAKYLNKFFRKNMNKTSRHINNNASMLPFSSIILLMKK